MEQALNEVLGPNNFFSENGKRAGGLDHQDDQMEHVDESQAKQTQVQAILETPVAKTRRSSIHWWGHRQRIAEGRENSSKRD